MADEGASPRELVLEASRRNNTDLLESVIDELKPTRKGQEKDEAVAELLNTARDGMGNTALHLAARGGHLDILDLILDQPGVETDPRLPSTLDTPLFSAVQFTNSSASSEAEGKEIIDILVDAGCDPRLRNKGKMKPVDLVDPRHKDIRDFLRRAELALTEGEGLINEDEPADEDAGPPSDSDDEEVQVS